MNVPKLRFPEFNDEWKKEKFKQFSYYSGKRNKDNLDLIPYAITNTNGFVPQNEAHNEFGYMKNTDRKAYNIVTPHSFAYNPARINVGSIGYYNDNKNIIVSSLYEVFKTKGYIDDKFLWFWLKSSKLPIWINKLQEGSVRQYFYYDKLCETPLHYPNIKEQEKIANFLSLLDKKIELQSRKIEDLKLFKSYIEKNTFKKINNYKEYQLKDVLINGNKVPVGNTKEYKKITVKLNFNGIEFANLNRDMADTRPFYIREKGEIIIGKQNYFNGSIALISEEFDKTICSNAIMSFKVKEDFNNKYIFYYLSQPSYIKQRSFLANGTGQKELSEKEFMKFNIRIPDISQQDKLVDKFELIAKKINAENNKLGQLNELKKGLMQSMFV